MTSSKSDSFHIEKTQATLFEVCKRLTNSTGISIFLLIIAAMITFGELVGTPDGGPNGGHEKGLISLPFMNLTMHWRYVAEIFVVLTCASIFRAFSLYKYERLIQFRLKQLLKGSNGGTVTWALEYPSVFYLFHRIRKLTKIGEYLTTTLFIILCLAGLAVLVYIMCHIGWDLENDNIAKRLSRFDTPWYLAAVFSSILLIAAVLIFKYTPKYDDREKILEALNKTD